jgi:hypothetical protein
LWVLRSGSAGAKGKCKQQNQYSHYKRTSML